MPEYDAIVVGAGPSGSCAAYFLARAGAKVAVLEKKTFPRAKTCGDGWTPRSMKVIEEMGISTSAKRIEGLRAYCGGRMMELDFPKLSNFPHYGIVERRRDLDTEIAETARSAGAEFFYGVEAVEPTLDSSGGTRVSGVRWIRKGPSENGGVLKVDEGILDSHFTLVADGASSPFGKALGIVRSGRLPMGLAIRTYYESPRGSDEFFESWLELKKGDELLPGYGWIFPLGDGTVNVGVGVLNTFGAWRDLNLSHLQRAFIDMLPPSHEITHDGQLEKMQSGRLPMGASVLKPYGNGWLVVGDAACMVNPFNGEGIAYAMETGKLAASLVTAALADGRGSNLSEYRVALHDIYGAYYRIGRLFVRVIGHPTAFSLLTRVSMMSRPLMAFALQMLGNLVEDKGGGGFDKAIRRLVRLVEKELSELHDPEIPTPPVSGQRPDQTKAGAA